MFAVEIALGLGEQQGIPRAKLLAGLPFDAAEVARRQLPVDWDTYVEVCDRLRDRLGGNTQMAEAAAKLPAVTPEVTRFAPLFVSPRRLVHFFARVLDPRIWPCIRVTIEDVDDELVRTESSIPAHFRNGESVFAAGLGAWRTTPCRLGLPPAEIIHAEVGSHRGTYVLKLPASRTIAARARRAAIEAFADYAARELEVDAAFVERTYDAVHETDADRLDVATESWHLTNREREVLELVARGLSNKEIALRSSCSVRTVEVHMTRLMRKSNTRGRAALVTAFWRSGT